jgi:predicted ATPase/DNA-binding winged helix-turn-helix (wHTH) protein
MEWVPLDGGGVDLSQQVIVRGDERVHLTTKERDLLAYLAQRPGRTVTRRELMTEVWGSSPRASEEPVYSVVKRLRAKIDRGAHKHIVGVHGDGYRWSPVAHEKVTERPRAPRIGFFGRAEELRALASAFDGGARLVTLVGPGGVGKTRCARELVANRAHVFCDLASATSEGTVLIAVAAALEIPLEGTEASSWVRSLGRALAATPDRIAVLDNAEQAIDILARVAGSWVELGALLLCTSREPLRVTGERVVSIGPLASADAIAMLNDRVAACGGVSEDAAIDAQIVERVDRLPLAIELAAAQMPHLTARGLLESLDAQLATLVAGRRDGPARHATLRAAVEWSWTFLEAREREVLAQLTVFAGSFTLESARAVVPGDDVAAVLASLCRRSLSRREDARFVLYAAVRELASERLVDPAAAQRRHARCFADVGESASALLEGARHDEGRATLVAELPEIRAAWKRSLGHDPKLAARLALLLDRALGLQAEKASLRRTILSQSRAGLDDPALECALLLAEGRVEGAPIALLEEACALAKDPRAIAEIRLALGERRAATDLVAAESELGRALVYAKQAKDSSLRGRVLAALGESLWQQGSVLEAGARLKAAIALHRDAGDRRSIARASAVLAHVDRVEGAGDSALSLLRQAEAAANELGEPIAVARALMDLGQHLTRTGDQAGARQALDEAAQLYERAGFARDRAFLHLHVAETLVGIRDLDRALSEARAGLAAMPDPSDLGRSTIHEAIGCIQMLRDELSDAEQSIERGLDLARETGAGRSECTLLGKRGLVRLVRGEIDLAWADFDLATQKNRARGSSALEASSVTDRAVASFALGKNDVAASDIARARELLHHPSEEQRAAMLLLGCEHVGRAIHAVRAGGAANEIHAELRRTMAPHFARVPPLAWDVALRQLDWLVDRVLRIPRA